ncbi:MAG: hypothetical protein BWY29_00909 [Microgenomates group bacterium ADurb.Bin238]|nr:MAG: hypothetical protein BWY29_00909 [Microgenomates group bacterium ADurb.Bin238]
MERYYKRPRQLREELVGVFDDDTRYVFRSLGFDRDWEIVDREVYERMRAEGWSDLEIAMSKEHIVTQSRNIEAIDRELERLNNGRK